MTTTLHVDATRAFSPAAFLAALVDLGVAPSPLMHAVNAPQGDAGLGFDRRVDHAVALVDAEDGVPAARVVADAALPPRERAFTERVAARAADAGAPLGPREALAVAGTALALADVAAERVLVSRVNVGDGDVPPAVTDLLGDVAEHLAFDAATAAPATTPAGAALVRALAAGDALGAREPAWAAAPARGRGLDVDGREVRARVGRA